MSEQGTFEDAVTRLEEIVSRMETGNLPLEECLRHFEEAVALSRYCAQKLETAEKQICILTAAEGLQPAADLPWADRTDNSSAPAEAG